MHPNRASTSKYALIGRFVTRSQERDCSGIRCLRCVDIRLSRPWFRAKIAKCQSRDLTHLPEGAGRHILPAALRPGEACNELPARAYQS
jgi:hypothetical protein